MGVPIALGYKEDDASGAQVIDGGLRFDSGKAHFLKRTPGSAGNRKTWTWSGWVKRNKLGVTHSLFTSYTGSASDEAYFDLNINDSDKLGCGGWYTAFRRTTQVFRDCSSWYHIVLAVDISNSTANDRLKMYINGVQVTAFDSISNPDTTSQFAINAATAHAVGGNIYYSSTTQAFEGQLSNVYLIDGQQLDASYFGYTDPLTNTWRPKKLSSSVAFGTNGFYLPFDGNSPIGQDQSGRGNNWTPVNFGGSNTLEKATGALPILNTDGGGKVARVGVRTDNNPVGVNTYCVLALPLVGIKSDFCNQVSGGTFNNKVVTANNGVSGSSAQSVFYGGSYLFDNTDDYLNIPNTDFNFGTGDYTCETWVYLTNTGDEYVCNMQTNNTGSPAPHWGINFYSTNLIRVGRTGDSNGDAVHMITYTFTTNRWYHIAVSRQSGTSRVFLDGVKIDEVADTRTIVPVADLQIGRYYAGGNILGGYLQDFRIYKGVAKYTQNFIPASTDPDILPDTPSGVAYSSNVALVPDADGGSVNFNGSNQSFSIPDSADFAFGSGDFTIETFAFCSPGSNMYWGQGDGASPAFVVYGTTIYIGPSVWSAQFSFTEPNNRWFHFALVRSGNTLTVYIDGIANSTLSYATSWPDSTDSFTIGQARGAYGKVTYSNFRVTKGQALYTSNFTPPTQPLTTTSQGATGSNVKLLCCKSSTSVTASDITPGTITANNSPVASNFNPFTVNINVVRGQESGYCTWNPLDTAGSTLSNGNLNITTPSSGLGATRGTIGISSGKWYYEHTIISGATAIGIMKLTDILVSGSGIIGASAGGYSYYSEGVAGGGYTKKINNGTQTDYGASFDPGDTISVAFDLDAGTITFYKNGISQGIAFSGLSGTFSAAISDGTNAGSIVGATNFGQKPFKFPPPPGFQPLALANTPRPTIVRPDQYVGITTWTGDGASSRQINVGFKPDLVWFKSRSVNNDHNLFDTVRGVEKTLSSNLTAAEVNQPIHGYVTSFNDTGFTVAGGSLGDVNYANRTYVTWAWKAGGNSNTFNINDVGYSTASAAGLTAGTITPTGASVNTKSGFSIIGYNGAGTNSALTSTISHGLTQAPTFMIVKARTGTNAADDWFVYHKSIGPTKRIRLNLTNAPDTQTWMGDTEPTSSLITLNQGWYSVNYTGHTHILYAWHDVPGFSKFGSYTGNNSTDGPVVITGFKPAFVLIRQARTDATGRDWMIFDNKRSVQYGAGGFNAISTYLYPNYNLAEASAASIDFLSNGFKIRASDSTNNNINGSGQNHIYAAFAEAPSFNLYGGQANAR